MTTQALVRLRTPVLLCAIAGVVALLGLVGGPTVERVAVLALVSIVFVAGLSTFSANSGIMSFGHVAFMALGAYTAAFLTIPAPLKTSLFSDLPGPLSFLRDVQSSFVVAVLVGGVVAAVLGLLTAPAIARLSGLQSGIATLAILMVIYNVLSSWTSVTRGSSSMIGIPQSTSLWSGLAFAATAILVAWAYQSSRSGLQLRASREDYWASVASGVSVGRHRATAWVLSAFLCGAAGALYACFITSFNVSAFFLSTTFSFIVMVVLGGYLSLSGAVLGAVAVSLLQEVLRRFQDGQFTGGSALPAGVADLVLAALLLVVLIKFPLGLMGSGELGQRRKLKWTDEVEQIPEGASA